MGKQAHNITAEPIRRKLPLHSARETEYIVETAARRAPDHRAGPAVSS